MDKDILNNFIKDKDNNNKSKILILVVKNDDDRKKIYQYIENITTIKAVGLYSKLFTSLVGARFFKCDYCKNKILIQDKHYRLGIESNNKDEFYVIPCDKCFKANWYEPNYDDNDNITYLHKNNIIVIGDYMKHNNKPRHAKENKDIDNKDIENILESNPRFFIINAPEKLLNKRKLQVYINENIDKKYSDYS